MRRPAAAVVLAALVAALLLPAVAAVAHPLGTPVFALLQRDGDDTLTLTWTPAPDDWVVLARHLDVPVGERWPDQVPRDASLTLQEQARLVRSEALRDYLSTRLRITQDGARCPGTVSVPTRLDLDSPVLRATCPDPVGVVAVTVTALVDIDTRYRTTLVAPTERRDARASLGADTPTAIIDLDAGTATLRVDPASLGGAFDLEAQVTRAVTGNASPLAALVLLALAFGVGAVHALAPGHGKAIAAAYLVAGDGRPRDAAALGVAVAVMHTGSVLLLALALWTASGSIDLDAVGATLQVAAGIAVLAVGVALAVRARRGGHDHGHPHGHVHAAAVPPAGRGRALSRPRLVALATAGGLLPSPTAVVVLLTALTLGRPGLGVAAVLAFSVGLAGSLTVIGLGVLWGRDRLADRPALQGVARVLPWAGAFVVLALGAVLVVRGLV